MAKYLIVYSYFQENEYENNLNFFIKNGFIDDPNYKFVIVVNGNTDYKLKNDNITLIKRENQGFDFAGWGHGLNSVKICDYDYFIFLNSTCIGPFIPRYVPNNLNWVNIFTSKLDSNIKLCGPTINYLNKSKKMSPHIQSFAFATDKTGIDVLLKEKIFEPEKNIDRNSLIENHEVRMSDVFLKKGFNLFAFQLSENIKYSNNKEFLYHDDIHFMGKYYDETINPLEVMFVKTKRIKTKVLENYIKFISK